MTITLLSLITLGGVGLVFAVLLAVLSKKLAVQVDPKVTEILNVLPGVNCGACGQPGCAAYAQMIAEKKSLFCRCIPGGDAVSKKIEKILGITASQNAKEKLIPVCRCGSTNKEKKRSFIYSGPLSCKSAHISGGLIDCAYGCLGLGDCVNVCPVNALSVTNGKISVNRKLCISCGKCVSACPRQLYKMIPVKDGIDTYVVSCNNQDSGPDTRKVCSRGCIACGLCAGVEQSPYMVKNNVSSIDYDKLTSSKPLADAKAKCPPKCIDKIL